MRIIAGCKVVVHDCRPARCCLGRRLRGGARMRTSRVVADGSGSRRIGGSWCFDDIERYERYESYSIIDTRKVRENVGPLFKMEGREEPREACHRMRARRSCFFQMVGI